MSKTKYRFTYDDDEDREDNKTGELASRIGAVLAHRAVDNLMTIAENLTVETMVAITKYLLSMDAERLVSMLKGLFLSHGMYEAAGELDLLDICSEYEEDAVCFFEEAFYDTDSMDWYSIGRRNNAKYQERHKEEIKGKKRKYYEEHRDEILDYHKKYYMEHKDEINAERTIV